MLKEFDVVTPNLLIKQNKDSKRLISKPLFIRINENP